MKIHAITDYRITQEKKPHDYLHKDWTAIGVDLNTQSSKGKVIMSHRRWRTNCKQLDYKITEEQNLIPMIRNTATEGKMRTITLKTTDG